MMIDLDLLNQFMPSILESRSAAFSSGQFADTYDSMSEMVVWNLVGSTVIQGKPEVIAFCEKMSLEMEGSELTNTQQIVDGNLVAVQGYCRYIKAGMPTQLFYCDVYQFEDNQIISITSYAIEAATTHHAE